MFLFFLFFYFVIYSSYFRQIEKQLWQQMLFLQSGLRGRDLRWQIEQSSDEDDFLGADRGRDDHRFYYSTKKLSLQPKNDRIQVTQF